MESFLIKALQLVVALVILVTVHEFGHYFFARIFGIKVNRFYLFFNPWFSLLKYDPMKGTLQVLAKDDNHSLATFQVSKPRQPRPDGKPTWRDTVYGLGWLPLGGYCDIAGMVDETKSSKDLASEPQPWEFRSKARGNACWSWWPAYCSTSCWPSPSTSASPSTGVTAWCPIRP